MRVLVLGAMMLALLATPALAQGRRPPQEAPKAEKKGPVVDEKAYEGRARANSRAEGKIRSVGRRASDRTTGEEIEIGFARAPLRRPAAR